MQSRSVLKYYLILFEQQITHKLTVAASVLLEQQITHKLISAYNNNFFENSGINHLFHMETNCTGTITRYLGISDNIYLN
jgi:hypothetical protein